jgi:general secretion pathway protein A
VILYISNKGWRIEVIEEFWGLREKPFLNTPDTRFLYPSGEFNEALARLLYHIKEVRGGISLITGEVGCGKTFLSVRLIESLPNDTYCKCLLINPKFSQTQFLKAILSGFGDKKNYRTRYNTLLRLTDVLERNLDDGKENVLVIDEAQLLTPTLIEEVRLLTNYEKPQQKFIQIILFAQPEFEKKVGRVKQFNQRIQVRYFLEGMTQEETREYIVHRLVQAGMDEPEIFSGDAFSEVYRISKGVPRVVNNICENALFIAYSLNQRNIDDELIREVAGDLNLGEEREKKN